VSSNFGVAVTTHNRPDVLRDTLAALVRYTPQGVPIVVVDDGSEQPATLAGAQAHGARLIRHDQPRGIPAAKNRCIEALMDQGVEHLILLDDDTAPRRGNWWLPYIEGEEPYYTYCWTHFAHNGLPVAKMAELYRDSNLVAYTWSMGCCQYVRRDVIETVGGLNPVFGMGFEEHAEWAQRIHNAGFTSFVHQDNPQMAGSIYAGDEHCAVVRSFSAMSRAKRQRLIERNTNLRIQRANSKEFVDYHA